MSYIGLHQLENHICKVFSLPNGVRAFGSSRIPGLTNGTSTNRVGLPFVALTVIVGNSLPYATSKQGYGASFSM